jgi:hypothetical protein
MQMIYIGLKRHIYIKIKCKGCGKKITASRIQDVGNDNSLHMQRGTDTFKIEKHKIKGFFSPICKKSGLIINRRYK